MHAAPTCAQDLAAHPAEEEHVITQVRDWLLSVALSLCVRRVRGRRLAGIQFLFYFVMFLAFADGRQ